MEDIMSNRIDKIKRQAILRGLVELTDVLMRLLKMHLSMMRRYGAESPDTLDTMRDNTLEVVSAITAECLARCFSSDIHESTVVMKEMQEYREKLNDDMDRFAMEQGWEPDNLN